MGFLTTLASFVGLTEVLFAVLFAWLVLGELPGAVQLLGGAVILAGIVAVRLGERSRAGTHSPADESEEAPERTLEPLGGG